MRLHSKIVELKKRAAPIAYSASTVSRDGKLENFNNLLDQRIVEGYGCIWGVKNSHDERFFKGCFARSIKENGPDSGAAYQIKFRDEHGRAMALFEVIEEDEIGLYFRTKPLDDVSWADDCLTQLRSGTINNFSDGFKYIFEDYAIQWNETFQSIDIYEARLFEISAVAVPSDLQTFALRSQDDPEELYELTEDFIKSLPRKNQLEARHLFARHKSLNEQKAQDDSIIALRNQEPTAKGLDYNYLLNNLKN